MICPLIGSIAAAITCIFYRTLVWVAQSDADKQIDQLASDIERYSAR